VRGTAARVARNVVWLGAGELALKGALFAAGVLVARGFGPPGMGAFTVAYGAALVLMQLLAGGQVEVLIRETARRPQDGRALYRRSAAYQRRLATAAIPLAAGGALLVSPGELRWTLLAFVPYALLRSRLITAGAVFKGLDRMDAEVRARALELGIALPLLAAVALAGAPVWATGVAFCGGAAGGLAWISARLRALPDEPPAEVTQTQTQLVREGVPFLWLAMLQQLVGRVDNFLLAGLGVAPAAIGRYGVAGAPVQGLAAASQVVAVAGYPSLARAAAAGALRARLVVAIAAGGAVLGGALALLLYVAREPLVRVVFGAEYAGSVPLLAVLVWTLPAASVSMLMGTVLAATRRQRWPLATQTLALVASVTANLLVIPLWGAAGCAAVAVAVNSATALVMIALAAVAAYRVRRAPAEVPPLAEVASEPS
jgi:O-antigen/teichoic acid export membrane protein